MKKFVDVFKVIWLNIELNVAEKFENKSMKECYESN